MLPKGSGERILTDLDVGRPSTWRGSRATPSSLTSPRDTPGGLSGHAEPCGLSPLARTGATTNPRTGYTIASACFRGRPHRQVAQSLLKQPSWWRALPREGGSAGCGPQSPPVADEQAVGVGEAPGHAGIGRLERAPPDQHVGQALALRRRPGELGDLDRLAGVVEAAHRRAHELDDAQRELRSLQERVEPGHVEIAPDVSTAVEHGQVARQIQWEPGQHHLRVAVGALDRPVGRPQQRRIAEDRAVRPAPYVPVAPDVGLVPHLPLADRNALEATVGGPEAAPRPVAPHERP